MLIRSFGTAWILKFESDSRARSSILSRANHVTFAHRIGEQSESHHTAILRSAKLVFHCKLSTKQYCMVAIDSEDPQRCTPMLFSRSDVYYTYILTQYTPLNSVNVVNVSNAILINRKRIGVHQALQSYGIHVQIQYFLQQRWDPFPPVKIPGYSDMKCVVERKTVLQVYVAHINDLLLYTESMPFIILFWVTFNTNRLSLRIQTKFNVWFINFEEIFCKTQCVF